jgi:hypothetical protein
MAAVGDHGRPRVDHLSRLGAPGEQFDQRGLARQRRPGHRDQLAGREVQVETVEHGEGLAAVAPEGLRERGRLHNQLRHGGSILT